MKKSILIFLMMFFLISFNSVCFGDDLNNFLNVVKPNFDRLLSDINELRKNIKISESDPNDTLTFAYRLSVRKAEMRNNRFIPYGAWSDEIKKRNIRKFCLTSTTLDTRWHSDFAKAFGLNLVQVEAQFGKVEAMFKDFYGFRIAYAERILALGIEIVLSHPSSYFAHRKNAIGGMASFDIAKNTLTTIGLDCPIWLIGII